MKKHQVDYRVVPYPTIRQWTSAAYRSVHRKPMIHGLIEVDVTVARARLRQHRAPTGEPLSFTAFVTACLAKAVDEDKAVQALRKGRKRLVIFDDVDVWIPIERSVAGQKQPLPHIVRAANHMSVRAIHDEIRAAQEANAEQAMRGPRFLPPTLFGLYIRLFWLAGRAMPSFQKRYGGTVALTAVGMFGKGAGWGIPPPFPNPLMVTVGGIGKKQELVDGQLTTREYLSLTISVDHDIVDGAPAARFTQRLSELIEGGYGLDDSTAEPEQARLADGSMHLPAPVRSARLQRQRTNALSGLSGSGPTAAPARQGDSRRAWVSKEVHQ